MKPITCEEIYLKQICDNIVALGGGSGGGGEGYIPIVENATNRVPQSKLTGAIYKDGIYLAKSLKPSDFDEVMIDEIDRSEDQEDED